PVRGADLTEHRAASQHDVGDAELDADLDQLPTGEYDFGVVGERLEGQEHGGRVVVDHEGVFGTGEPAQHGFDVAVAGSALLPDEIELEVRIGRGDGLESFERERAQERPTKVGVEDDALRVDNRPQGEGPGPARALDDPLG